MTVPAASPRRRISSITGLKAICALMVFWWHGPLPISPVDLGGRACEFFFLAAGFLYVHSHQNKSAPCTFAYSLEYMRKKMVAFYPLHLIGFGLSLFLLSRAELFTASTAVSAALNLTLLQAWSPSQTVYFGFNGVSWFLSALMFCYFLAIVVLHLLKKPRRAFWLLSLFLALRFALEYANIFCPEYFMIDPHVFPVARCLEFFCGMSIASLSQTAYGNLRSDRKTTVPFSILEIILAVLTVYLIIEMRDVWTRAHFVLLLSLLLLVFSFDRGIVSRLLSIAPLRWLGNIQLEFYMLHGIIINLIAPHLTFCYWNWYVESTALCLSATLAAVMIYRLILKKPMERGFDLLSKRIMTALHSA